MTKIQTVKPAAISVRRASRAAARGFFRLKPLPQIIRQSLALAFCSQLPIGAMAATPLPAPGVRVPLTALPTGPTTTKVGSVGGRDVFAPQVVSGQFKPYTVNTNANGSVTGTITQTNNAGILQWQKFDIGANATVNVVQPSSTAVLLNKVSSGEFKNSTVIEGALNANGQVYVYNPNGIIFGKNSQVNVNTLVATTLKIDDARFQAGLIAPNVSPIFARDGIATPGTVVIEGERNAAGALEQGQINAARGGKILLVGSSVTNNGQLSAPDGQVLAAASTDRVFLAAPSNVQMRGLLVEVGTGGAVSNEALGKILVERGNVSLVGAAVNQSGSISATTSVQANGSIYLRARDGAEKDITQPATAAVATRGGVLTLGENSLTEILPDLADKTTAPKSSYNPSQIDLAGQSVYLMQNALVRAPAGEVTLTAQTDPRNRSTLGIAGGKIGSKGVYMAAGATIDVAGTTHTELAMESNVIAVELRGTELADFPLQRNSVLRGRTVYIDRRRGTPLANVQGYLDLREYGVGENTAVGGNVTFNADQEVVVAEGARINVSGGLVSYRSGYVATTQLQSGNFSVDIGSASPDRLYTGFSKAVAGPRNFEVGYSEGRSAGSVRFDVPALLLRGSLEGRVTPGARQRDLAAADYPLGGQIIIGGNSRLGSGLIASSVNYSFLGTIDFGGGTTAAIKTPAFDTQWDAGNAEHRRLRSTVDIDTAQLSASGFTRINAYARSDDRTDADPWGSIPGAIQISTAVTLKPGGELRLAAQDSALLNAGVTIPGGNLEVVANGLLTIAPGLSLDVAGLWTNDKSAIARVQDSQGNLSAPIVTRGGSIVLSGRGSDATENLGITVGAGTHFDAAGGAWQNSAGKIAAGNGGNISLVSGAQDATAPRTAGLALGYGVDFQAYSLNTGGSVRLGGGNVVIQKDPVNAIAPYLSGLFYLFGTGGSSATPVVTGIAPGEVDLAVSASWFTRGGFSRFDVGAAGSLTVTEGTLITPRMDNWIADRATASSASGRMADAFNIGTLPLGSVLGSRGASSVNLSAAARIVDNSGRLWLQKGAAIVTDPGATVSLSAGRQLTVDGRVTAPGGTVNLLLTPDPADSTLFYRPERSVWLGSTAVVDVSGTAARLWNNRNGITQGDVLDGGSIRIGRSGVSDLAPAAGFVVIEKGASLLASGTSADMTLSAGRFGPDSRLVASAGGSIDIRAREGMLIEGQFSAGAGGANAAGGNITLVLDREGIPDLAGAPSAARDLVVLSEKLSTGSATGYIVPRTLKTDQPFGSDLAGKAYVLADALSNGGFDRIRLKSQDKISFDTAAGGVGVSARTEIVIDAPVIATINATPFSTVALTAAHVGLGNSEWRYQAAGAAASAAPGEGAILNINATTIDLTGRTALQGFGAAFMNAQQEVRLAGVVAEDLSIAAPVSQTPIHTVGSFQVAGSLNLNAAQVYPTTLSEFSLSATGAGSRIEFQGNGTRLNTPLSAAGTLTVSAENILQNGVLLAPFGSIALTAQNKLSFGADSLTSVAGDRSVPLGRVNNGRDWLYDFGNGHTVTLGNTNASNGVALPSKKILSTAPNIDLANGAVIDLAGGGDLYAYEFTAGPGGSRDVLAKPAGAAAASIFAVKPGYDASFAPLDFQYQQDGGLKAGDRIYLSGRPGLAAGFYTLLPAHYALLPGAFAVTVSSGTRDMVAASNSQKPDGSWLVAGYRGSFIASDSRSSGFVVTSSDQVRTQSQFTDYSANTVFAQTGVNLPKSGGQVVFSASSALALDGLIKLGAVDGGRRGIADFSAPEIQIVANDTQATGGAVRVLATDLTALGADSILIGGVRDIRDGVTQVTVGAKNVRVSNDAAHPLSGPEIILAAKDSLTVSSGSVITGNGVPDASGGDLLISGTGAGADGALVRVSGGTQVAVVRNTPAGATGTLTIENGVTVRATGSMNLDATKSFKNQGQLELGDQAAVSFGANRISLGDALPAAVDGLRIDSPALAVLNRLSDLSLTSYTTFDVYGDAALGSASARTLSLRGAGIQSYGKADTRLSLTADTVRFEGGGTFTPAFNATVGDASAGKLIVSARDIEIGSNSFAVKGYQQVGLIAQREIRAVGKGANLSTEKDMSLAAGVVTVTSGSDAALQAGGKLILTGVAAPQVAVITGALGGNLTFVGDAVVSDATIVAKSGQITLKAQGVEGVRVSGGLIDTSGSAKTFGSTVAYAPGGGISLDGGLGSVAVDAAATLDVSAVGASAGTLAVKAANGSTGSVSIDGVLKGGSEDSSQSQGQFALDADTTGGAAKFSALNTKLNASGFAESRSIRIRSGDIILNDVGSDASAITAHQVVLAADSGNVVIGGTIDARGTKGGRIAIYAGQKAATGDAGNVTLLDSAKLLASATQTALSGAGSTGDGGSVLLGTSAADGQTPGTLSGNNIALKTGALIDVSANGLGNNGKVTLRAPRTGTDGGNDVAISDLGASILGSGSISIEGYKVYTGSTIGAAADSATNLQAADTTGTPAGRMYNEAVSFMANEGAIRNRLGPANAGIVINPGLEVRSTGDLTVSVNETVANAQNRGWNLNAWRFGAGLDQPGALTMRAANNLIVNGSISDGFVKPATRIAMPGWTLDPTGNASWRYQLAGGADFASADPGSVLASASKGDVTLRFARTGNTTNDQPVALIRTGSGDIKIAAGRDVVLGSITVSVPDPYNTGSPVQAVLGATIYTAGRFTPLETGFLAPNNQTINSIYTNGTSTKTTASFATRGGAIEIEAGRDVSSAATRQLVNNWLYRRGAVTTDANGAAIYAGPVLQDGNTAATRYESILSTGWWSRYDYFNQGVATFGGGDIAVSAGRNVNNLSLSVATSGQVPGTGADQKTPGVLMERGGGDISLRAGGNIRGGSFYVQKGNASLSASGSVVAGDNTIPDGDLGSVTLRPVLALGDGKIDITALGNVEIETTFNPTLLRQDAFNAEADLRRRSPLSVFSTYSADSSVNLTSLAGDVILGNHAVALTTAAAPWKTAYDNNTVLVYPASLKSAAFSGSFIFENGFSLWPSPTGELELLASKDVLAAYPRNPANQRNTTGAQPIVMIDAAPTALPRVQAPLSNTTSVTNILNPTGDVAGLASHTDGGLHANDAQPVRIVALSGDVVGESFFGGANFRNTLVTAKPLEVQAGRDIRDFGFRAQHLRESDVSAITAGRDFIDTTYSDLSRVQHDVSGPGRIDITAGRNIDLGTSGGIVTRGNLDNPYLPEAGASINLVAGAKSDYAGFVARYVSAADLSATDGAALVAYLRERNPALPSDLSVGDALGLFNALPRAKREGLLDVWKPALNDIFFAKLRVATGSAGGGALDLPAFDALIDSLYPAAGISAGDINVFGSQIKTARGGSINLFAPGGSVQAGLTEKPAWVKQRLLQDSSFESNLGLYTIAGGNLQALVKNDFLVNQGRVFTLGGGDITLVSQYGDIDAGKGAKTAQSTPPPVIRTDQQGNTIVDISGSIAGSGIATLRTTPEVPASSVYPIAPRGIFDAGDAGVRSTGSVNIVAQTVINANNISAGGSVSGAKADSSGLAPAVAAPSSATPAAKTDAIANPPTQTASAAANLTVELLGFGAVDSQQSVIEERQTSPSADPDKKDDEKDRK